MSERFYLNCELKPGEIAVLEGPQAHHLLHVCRFRAGDTLCLFNGNGYEYPALIQSVAKRSATLHIMDEHNPQTELPFLLTITAPLPKGDRATFLIEKLVEIGVASFVPLQTDRSVVRPSAGKLEKLRRLVIEACKQCGRNVLMKIEAMTVWEKFCALMGDTCAKIIAQPGDNSKTCTSQATAKNIIVAVGPEGGWTDEEMQLAQQHHWQFVNAGARIMRIETAAIFFAVRTIVEWNSFRSE